MQQQKTVMIVLTELNPRVQQEQGIGLFNNLVTSERIHRILDVHGVLAIPGTDHVEPKMFCVEEKETIHNEIIRVVKTASELTERSLAQMQICPEAKLAIKAHCVITNETIEVAEVKRPHQVASNIGRTGPQYLTDHYGHGVQKVFFQVLTPDDAFIYSKGDKFTTGVWNPEDIVACSSVATDYWMNMAKDIVVSAQRDFNGAVLADSKLIVWEWHPEGSNRPLYERDLVTKTVALKTIPVVAADTDQEDTYASIPNAGDFKSKYLVKELSVDEVMAGIVQLFENPDAEDLAQHNHNLRTVQWDLVLKGSVTFNVRKAVTEIMDNKGWTVEFATVEDNTTNMSISAVIKG